MNNNKFGNRITDNAFTANDGRELIKKALVYIKDNFEWFPVDNSLLFSGVYYDSQKVGSYIVKVQNKAEELAVLKIQLKSLPFDEGYIIRYIDTHNKSEKIKTPEIISNMEWNEELGFGYLLFKDVSGLDDIWKNKPTTESDRILHKVFLQEFLNITLPIKPWFGEPDISLNDFYKKTFEHFEEIVSQSTHHHIPNQTVKEYKDIYYQTIDSIKFEDVSFTHAHLSGKDIKYNTQDNSFTIMANLYWSFRPRYYELTFPIWVDIMHIFDSKIMFSDVLERINDWGNQWQGGLFDHDPTITTQYWFNLLERAIVTIMLDLGASEWRENEQIEKQALLNVWQELFKWIIEHKINPSILIKREA